MMDTLLGRWLVVAVMAVLVVLALGASVFTVGPGEDVVLERNDHIVAGPYPTGVHWKVPGLESLVRMDSRLRLAKGRVRTGAKDKVLSVHYLVLWQIDDVHAFYQATGGDGNVVGDRLDAALGPVLHGLMADGAQNFLKRPAESVDSALHAAAVKSAAKLGIDVAAVKLVGAQVPQSLQRTVGKRMAAAAVSEASAASSASRAQQETWLQNQHLQVAAIVQAARREAATVRGRSEAQAARIYAGVAPEAPRFFSFYQNLISEEQGLKSHTRMLVIHTDSNWFRVLRAASNRGGKPGK